MKRRLSALVGLVWLAAACSSSGASSPLAPNVSRGYPPGASAPVQTITITGTEALGGGVSVSPPSPGMNPGVSGSRAASVAEKTNYGHPPTAVYEGFGAVTNPAITYSSTPGWIVSMQSVCMPRTIPAMSSPPPCTTDDYVNVLVGQTGKFVMSWNSYGSWVGHPEPQPGS